MPDKFQNKYRISSARLQHWDYGWNAAYFVTICTKNREHFFGKIIDGKMVLSPLGVIADILWYEIKNHAKNIELGEFVVMPNHIHGIIFILNDNGEINLPGRLENPGYKNDSTNLEITGGFVDIYDFNDDHDYDDQNGNNGNNGNNVEETRHVLSLQPEQPKKSIGQQRCQNQGKNTLSSMVGGYKSAVTKHANRLHFNFAWQTRFHDHIIRDEISYNNISAYIINNPANWPADKFSK